MIENKKRIVSFQDLDVFQTSYKSMLIAYKEIIPKLPKQEDYDLKDQLRRSSKAIPRLIAEGYSKRHQKKGFQKYIDDAMTESNETIVSLNQVRDLYSDSIDLKLCEELIDAYDKVSRQLYNLALSWDKYNRRDRKTNNDTSYVTVEPNTNNG
jgi:four helix bundle protein